MKALPFTGTKENKKTLVRLFAEYGCEASFTKFNGTPELVVFGTRGSSTHSLGTWLIFGEDKHRTVIILSPDQIDEIITGYVANKYKQWFEEGEEDHE